MVIMSVLGTRLPRVEDHRLVTGRGTYVDNLRAPDALCATFVRSPYPHARLLSIDSSAAGRAVGVVGVFTAADVELAPQSPAYLPEAQPAMACPYLATGSVRFVGEPVAMVLTEGREQGEDAAEQVVVEYEPRPAVISVERALADGVLVFPEARTNLVHTAGTTMDDDFGEHEVVVTQRMINQRLAAAPMEPRAYLCQPSSDGRLTLWASTQNPHILRDDLVRQLGLDSADLRVIAPDVGGAFGSKSFCDPEIVLVCWAARRLGRAVRWVETRTESMLTLGHGRAQVQTVTIAGRRDGTVTAYRLDVLADAGAYPRLGAFIPEATVAIASGTYAIARVEARSRSLLTNTNPTTAYRGAGRPEAIAAIERAMDLFAAATGIDAAVVRERNAVAPQSFPYTLSSGVNYDTGDYGAALRAVLAAADYTGLRAEQSGRREAGSVRQIGIGLSSYVDITGEGTEYARLELRPDATVVGYTGTSPHGQGHETAFAMVVADALGLPVDRVAVRFGDTDELTNGGGTFGSRSLQTGGSALHEASRLLVERASSIAAALLGVDDELVDRDTTAGDWHVRNAPGRRVGWGDVATHDGAGLTVETEFKPTGNTCPFGAHLAVVEVDIETGGVTIVRFLAVDDAGNLVNPLIAEGQRHGGIAQGIGQALFEEFTYDDAGNPLTATLADYTIPAAADLPSFELLPMHTPTPANALGVKGIGESGTIGATPAVQNAVIDAVAHLGVRHIDLPLTPQRVWNAIRTAPTDR